LLERLQHEFTVTAIPLPRFLGVGRVARANISVGVSPERFLWLSYVGKLLFTLLTSAGLHCGVPLPHSGLSGHRWHQSFRHDFNCLPGLLRASGVLRGKQQVGWRVGRSCGLHGLSAFPTAPGSVWIVLPSLQSGKRNSRWYMCTESEEPPAKG
jgi:hypothetical protein